MSSGWVEGALVKICEIKPVDVGVEGELDGRYVLMCDHRLGGIAVVTVGGER